MESLLVTLTLWKTTLHIGEIYGCRPGGALMMTLSTLEEREGLIAPSAWWAYLWPWLLKVDDDYAACLADALGRAVAELRDPGTDLHHRLNGSEAATLTRGALGNKTLDQIGRLRVWCEGGAFEVLPHPAAKTLLRRS